MSLLVSRYLWNDEGGGLRGGTGEEEGGGERERVWWVGGEREGRTDGEGGWSDGVVLRFLLKQRRWRDPKFQNGLKF